MNILLDTCVVIDVLQNRQPFAHDGQKLFLFVAQNRIKACITAKSVTDIYYLSHKLTHSDKETRNILGKLFTLFSVIDTTGKDCQNAMLSDISDYEDAVMIETAKRNKVDYIVTRNIKDYKNSPVKIILPLDLVTYLESH